MSGRTWFRLGLVVLAALAVGWGAVSIAGTLSSQTRVLTRTEASVRTVEVHAGMGSVRVTGAPAAREVALRQTQRWWFGNPSFDVRRDGDRLVVRSACQTLVGRPCEGRLDITVPPGTDLDIRTDDGAVHLAGLSGAVRVRSGDGAIDATGLRGAEVDLGAGDGAVDAAFVTAPRRIRVSAGDAPVEVLVPRDGRPWRVEGDTADGSRTVEVAQDPEADRVMTVDTADGSVRVGYTG